MNLLKRSFTSKYYNKTCNYIANKLRVHVYSEHSFESGKYDIEIQVMHIYEKKDDYQNTLQEKVNSLEKELFSEKVKSKNLEEEINLLNSIKIPIFIKGSIISS